MVLARAKEAFDHPEWDLRAEAGRLQGLGYVDAGSCSLVSRKRNVYKSFQSLCTAIWQGLGVTNAIRGLKHVSRPSNPRSPLSRSLIHSCCRSFRILT
jgi:hypothetical protein